MGCSKCAWRKVRKRLFNSRFQGCAKGWGCGRKLPLQQLQLAHLRQLGMGGDRGDGDDPRNSDNNLALLCENCHRGQEASWRRFNFLWKEGYVEWMEPTVDNYDEFFRRLMAGEKARMDAKEAAKEV